LAYGVRAEMGTPTVILSPSLVKAIPSLVQATSFVWPTPCELWGIILTGCGKDGARTSAGVGNPDVGCVAVEKD